jgi:hypothetical protein
VSSAINSTKPRHYLLGRGFVYPILFVGSAQQLLSRAFLLREYYAWGIEEPLLVTLREALLYVLVPD